MDPDQDQPESVSSGNVREALAAPGTEPRADEPDSAVPESTQRVDERPQAEPTEASPASSGNGEGVTSDEASEAAPAGQGGEEPKKKKRRKRKRKPTGPDAHAEGSARPPSRLSERTPFRVGEEVYGKVTAVLTDAIMVDLSGKALAVFDRGEMAEDDLVPGVGDRFVAHVHNDGARGGLVVLTRQPLREEQTKLTVEAAFEQGNPVFGLVTGVIKGGVEVDIGGLRAFAPASGMDLHPANASFASLLGARMDFKILQFDRNGRDIVVTRRPMLEAEAHERRKQALGLLTEGQVLEGVVRTVVEWGIFVAMPSVENLEGLVHVSEASHDPRANLTEMFKPGDKMPVKIVKIDEKGKIWLSRKALVQDPWAEVRERFAIGTRHTGTIKNVVEFGAFVELTEGIEGLMHAADLSFDRAFNPKETLEPGASFEVVIAHLDWRNRKMTLHPAPVGERANETPQRVAKGATLKVEVSKIESAGLVVRLLGVTGRAARGFIPAGQTGTPRGTELRKAFKLGTVIEAKVVDFDPRRGEAKLSIRGLADDEERKAAREYRQQLHAQGGFGTLGDLFRQKLALASSDVSGSDTKAEVQRLETSTDAAPISEKPSALAEPASPAGELPSNGSCPGSEAPAPAPEAAQSCAQADSNGQGVASEANNGPETAPHSETD